MYGKSNDKPHNASFKDIVFLKIKSRPLLTNGVSLVTLIKTFTSLFKVAFIELPFSLKIIISLLSAPFGICMYNVSSSSLLNFYDDGASKVGICCFYFSDQKSEYLLCGVIFYLSNYYTVNFILESNNNNFFCVF